MKKFAETWWTIQDVQWGYEDVFEKDCPWSDKQCETFLEKYEKWILQAVCCAGIDAIQTFLVEEVN